MGIFDKLKNIAKPGKTCHECGTKMGADDLFCPRCGKKYKDSIVCPNCGASISKNTSFCTKCGNPLIDDSVTEAIDYSQKFDFFAREVTNNGDLKGEFQIDGKIIEGIIKHKAIKLFGWDAYKKIGIPICCSIYKQITNTEQGTPVCLLHVEHVNVGERVDNSVSYEDKIKIALDSLEQEGCRYFQNIDLNQTKNGEDVIQSLPFENRDYASRVYGEIKHAIFDLKEDADGISIKRLIESVEIEGLEHLGKEKQLNTFLAALYFEIHDVEKLKKCLRKELYNNFGFYYASLLQEDQLRNEFAKKHLIDDRYLPHLDHTVVFAGVCEFLRENDYIFLKEIEKINDKESYSSALKFLLRANSLSYESTSGLSKSEEYRYLYKIACEKFLGDFQVAKKSIFNSELSSDTYLFTPDDVSQLGASLGKVEVNGILYKGSIQKSDLPQGKNAWELIGSKFQVYLKGDLQTGQPGGDYYKLMPIERQIVNSTQSQFQPFPLYAKAHELKFKKNRPSEAKKYYIQSISDERESQKRVSSVPDLVSIFIQERNYEDAIAYLTKYKADIRPQAYDSFMNTIAIKQGKESVYIPTTKTEFPLYDLAHQTLFDFRQRDEAIVQYREAIQAGQNIGASVAELITVLIQIQSFDECAELLSRYGNDMKPTAYENQKKQVLSFRPDLEAKILGNKQLNKKSNLHLATEACDSKDFDKAIMFYEAAIQEGEELNQSVPELIQLYLRFGLESMAESIYMDNQKKLEKTNVKTVLKNFYEYYSKKGNEIKKEEIDSIFFSIFNEHILEKEETGITNSDLEYSDKNLDYFKEKVLSCSLPMEKLKGKYTESTAIDLNEKFDNYLFECSEEDLEDNNRRVKNYLPADKVLMLLKMVKGFINTKRETLKDKDERRYVSALVYAILYFGDNPPESISFDYSRYCYKKVVSLFSDSSKELSVFWSVALFSYFETYCNNEHSYSLSMRRTEHKYDKEIDVKEKLNEMEKLFNSIDSVEGTDLFISCISILEGVNKYKGNVLENLYNSKLKMLLCIELNNFNNSKEKDIANFDAFKKAWNDAETRYHFERKDFTNNIKLLLNVAKSQGQLSTFQNELKKIEEHSFVRRLCFQDKQYFTKLVDLLKLLNDFYSDNVFEQQKSNLENVVKQVKLLIKSIRDIPTEIFYDALLTELVGFELTLSRVVEAFFLNGKPELDFIIIDEAIEDFDESQNRVLRIPLKIKNKNNVQNALRLNITIQEESSSFEYMPDWANGQNIPSGKSIDNEILFEFPESFDISSDIQFKISYTFEYYQDFTRTTRSFLITRLLPPVSIKKDDPYILREGQNPYAEYAGGTEPVDKDEMFFGRDDLLNRIQDRIENRKTRWICLYGQRRTGKTSIRNHSIKRLSQNEKNLIVSFDIESIQSLQGFFFKILSTLYAEITEKKHPSLKLKMISDGKKIMSIPELSRELYVPPEVSETIFTNMIHDFISYIETIDKDYKVVLFIDEFTRIYDLMRSGTLPNALVEEIY